MAAAATMELHDRRLSVSKSSSSKISKPSSAPRPPSAASSRPPPTFVSADLSSFRRVVQQLTGTQPLSAISSPVREPTRSSRLQRIAPPPLRDSLRSSHHQQDQQNQQQVSNLPPLQQPHPLHMQHDSSVQDSKNDFSWLSSVLSPPLPYTQITNLNQNPDSNFNAFNKPPPYPNPNLPLLSPHLFSALPPLTPSDNTWANPLPSPRPLSNSAGELPSLLPLPSESREDLESGGGHSRSEAFEWPALSIPSSNGHPLLPSSSNGHPLLPSSSNGHPLLRSSSNGSSLLSSSSNEYSLLGPSPNGHPVFPPSPASLSPRIPLSPSTTSFNPWLPPWPTSPFLPLPFSPGLCPPSPGIGPFISSPRGFSFCASSDYPSKLP